MIKKIDIKDFIWAAVVLANIVWTIAIMPSQIIAEVNARFASRERVDMIGERLDSIDQKLERLVEGHARGLYK